MAVLLGMDNPELVDMVQVDWSNGAFAVTSSVQKKKEKEEANKNI